MLIMINSGCPFPGHFGMFDVFQIYHQILNNYLDSIGSEPVQPTNGTNATVNGRS